MKSARSSAKSSIIIALLLSLPFFISSCKSWSRTAQGAVIGAGGGAAIGAVIGETLGNTAAGAIAGAAVGGTVGAVIGRDMDRRAAEIEEELDGVTVQRVGEGIAVSFDNGILFGFDSATLRPAAYENLQQLSDILDRDDETNLTIVGHTDATGSADYNMDLSERRAQSAADYMISEGLAASRITIEGRGESEPIGDNDTEAGRQENRRVEVAIYASEEYISRLERQANN